MGLFEKFRKPQKPQSPERVREAGLLFCPEADPDRILKTVEELFQLPPSGRGNNITLRNGDMEMILLACSSREEGENGGYAKKQLEGVAGYVHQHRTELVEIKRNLFYHLRQCKGVVQIVCAFDSAGPAETREKEEQMMAALLPVTERLQGVITFGDGLTLRNSRGQVILDREGRSELEFYLPSEVPVPENWGDGAPPECMDRRNRSMELLRERHIYVTPWLPLLGEEEKEGPVRTVREICGRAAALLIVSVYSECRLGEKMSYEEAKQFVKPIMEGYGAEEFFSPKEAAYLADPDSTEQTQIQFAWQYENLWVMEWALGLTDGLFWPDHICDVPLSARLMREHPVMEELEAAASPRPYREVLDQADLIYRLHWACVDARVMGMPAPQGLEEGVVMERHRALFWLAGCDDRCGWDDVDLST